MTTCTRPVLRYHGGKWKLAPWIISNFPAHRVYVEPFGGAASVLMQKPRSYAEVYNDRWGIVVNVFRILRDPTNALELERLLRLTPFARDEFDACGNAHDDPIELARQTIFHSFAGFGSAATDTNYSTGFRSNSNRSGTTPAHDWANYPNFIRSFTERLQGVVIENTDAAKVVLTHDGPETLHYVDPPYPHSTRTHATENRGRGLPYGDNEMSDDDHRALAATLRSVKGMVVISGYPCDLYDVELYPDWTRIERKAFADRAIARTEVLWLSPNIHDMRMF